MDKIQIFIILGLSLLSIIIFLLIEYILYCLIYYCDYIVLCKIIHVYSIKLLKYLSRLILLGLNIFLIQIFSLSFVFLIGGFNKQSICYDNFKVWLTRLINRLKQIKLRCERRNFYEFSHIKYLRNFNKIYKNLNLQGISFELKQFQFGDSLELILMLFDQLKNENITDEEYNELFHKLLNTINKLIDLFRKYKDLSTLQVFFKFKHKSFLTFLSKELLDTFLPRETLYITIEKNFEIIIIKPNNELSNESEKQLIIFCGQNALCRDLYALYQDNIKYYLKNPNSTILLWDYQGYGRRKGFPTFKNIYKDVLKLANYIKTNYKDYKYIIHGVSIGGFSSVKLRKELNEDNSILIADRTYSDIDYIIQFGISYYLKFVYNFIFPKFFFHSSNVEDYILIKGNNKMIFYDENDLIINYNASLFMGVKHQYYKEIVYPQIIKLLKNEQKIKNIFNVSEIIFSSESLKKIMNDLIKLPSDSFQGFEESNLFYILKNQSLNLDDFILDVLILAYPLNIYKEIDNENINIFSLYEKIPFFFKRISNKINSNNIKFFFSQILFYFIKLNLNTNISDDNIFSFEFNENTQFTVKLKIKESIFNYFGRVHRIFCGHNGTLTEKDEQYLSQYLTPQNNI